MMELEIYGKENFMIIDASKIKNEKFIMFGGRQCGKTYTNLMMQSAYVESLLTGLPVEVKLEFVKVKID